MPPLKGKEKKRTTQTKKISDIYEFQNAHAGLFFNFVHAKSVNFINIFRFTIIKHIQDKYQSIYLKQKPLKHFCFC